MQEVIKNLFLFSWFPYNYFLQFLLKSYKNRTLRDVCQFYY